MRNVIREDVLFFVLPAALVYCSELVVSAWDLVRQQEGLWVLSVHSIAGLALIVIGLTIALIAAGTLRRSYSSTLVIREDHQLITHGVYRYTRHPVYLGAVMVCLGVPVYTSSLYGLLIMAALIPLVLNRIRIEERMLTGEFRVAYGRYKKATRKLIPFIY